MNKNEFEQIHTELKQQEIEIRDKIQSLANSYIAELTAHADELGLKYGTEVAIHQDDNTNYGYFNGFRYDGFKVYPEFVMNEPNKWPIYFIGTEKKSFTITFDDKVYSYKDLMI